MGTVTKVVMANFSWAGMRMRYCMRDGQRSMGSVTQGACQHGIDHFARYAAVLKTNAYC